MAKKNSLLWEIRKNKEFKGYLFGSMHVPAELVFEDLSAVYSALNHCDCFATEIPLDSKSQFEMGKHMKLPNHVSLKNLLSEKKYEKYEVILKKSFDLPLEQFTSIMPLFLLNYMTQVSISADPKDLSNSMDLQLWNYAKTKGKVLDSVEALDDHIATLYNIPLSYQVKALKEGLSNVSKFRKKSKKMLDLYRSQNIHKLYSQSKKSLQGIREVLLYRRNRIMTENIIRITDEHTAFIVAGAGHLAGEKGIIHSLKKAGYKVKPRAI